MRAQLRGSPLGGPTASRSVAIRDVTLVVAVSLVYLGFEFLSIPKRWSFLFAGLALGAYVVYLAVDRRHSRHDLGFRRDNLTAGLLPVGVCTAVAPPRVTVLVQSPSLQVLLTAAAFASVH